MAKKTAHVPLFSIAIIIFAVFIVLIPLIRRGFFVSDDGEWMIIRLSAFYQAFREGQFPVRFLGRLNNSYGYPVANFLYPGFLYIGSVLHAIGFSFVDSVKLILAGSVIGATIFLYLWLRTFFTPRISAAGVLSFVFAPYLLHDMYKRGSVGEVLAICWAAMGLYAIDSKKSWLFSLALALLIVSHNSLALLFSGFFLLYLMWLRRINDFLYPYLLGVGMTTFFWLPAIIEQTYVVFRSATVANPSEYLLKGLEISRVGLAFVVFALILMIKHEVKQRVPFFICVLCGIVILTLPISAPVWKLTILKTYVQFPFRFLSLGLFVGPWIVAFALQRLRGGWRVAATVLIAILWLHSVGDAFRSIRFTQEVEGYYTTNESTTTVHDEYMPRWVVMKPKTRPRERMEFINGSGRFDYRTVSTQLIDATVDAHTDSIIQINTIYYPGWGASLNDRKVVIDYNNDAGVMRIAVPKGTYRLIVAFRETVSRFAADVVSIIAFILFLVYARSSQVRKYPV